MLKLESYDGKHCSNLKSTKRSVFVFKVDCRTRLPVEIQLTTFCNYSMLFWDNCCSLVASFSSTAVINVSLYNNISLLSIFNYFSIQSCFVMYNWASEASPTLGCSIEMSRDICICYSTGRSDIRDIFHEL